MNDFAHHTPTFYGTATVGSKGQIVIPAKAREELNIQTGDTLVVFGKGYGMIGICPADHVKAFLADMTKKLEAVQNSLEKTEQKKGN